MEVDQAPVTTESDIVSVIQTIRNRPLELTEKEKLALELWDQAEELRLELSLLEAQLADEASMSDISDDNIEEQLATAEQKLLEARGRYMIRQTIIQDVLLIDPLLKAVHGGANATSLEERLSPHINERDVLVMLHTTITSKLAATRSDLSKIEVDHLLTNQKNRDLAHTLLGLADELKDQTTEDVEDPRTRAQLEAVEKEVRASRRRWRVMKSIAAAMVVGSGIDWANDGRLMELVMDDEEELG